MYELDAAVWTSGANAGRRTASDRRRNDCPAHLQSTSGRVDRRTIVLPAQLLGLCTGLLQGLRHGPQFTVVRGQVSIHVRRPGLAEETFLDQSVAELRVVDQNLSVEKIQSLKPFMKPGISEHPEGLGVVRVVVDPPNAIIQQR